MRKTVLTVVLVAGFGMYAYAQTSPPVQAAFAQQALAPPTLDETVKLYCAAWGEPDVDRRRKMLERTLVPEATYTDPSGHAESREALVQRITEHLQKRPGLQIVPSSHADLHHGMLRFTWKAVWADGKTMMEGIDFVEVTADGKLRKIVGFFGPIKPLEMR